jgi:hypothetical protein
MSGGRLGVDELIDGAIALEDANGMLVAGPEPCRLRWAVLDDGSWEVAFVTSHQLEPTTRGRLWLRFDDADGRTRLRQPMGLQDGVVVLPLAHE